MRWPTPGIVISRRQISSFLGQTEQLLVEELDLVQDPQPDGQERVEGRQQQRPIGGQLAHPGVEPAAAEPAGEDAERLEQAADQVDQVLLDVDQPLARDHQALGLVAGQAADMDLFQPAGLGEAGQAFRIAAVGLARPVLESGVRLPGADADHRHAQRRQPVGQP